MTDTPVALIIFRRPDVTRRVVDAIRQAGVRRLFVIADGPRGDKPTDVKLVQETRELLSSLDWECDVTRIYSEVNLGLRERVLTGLDEVFNQVDRAIVLEDDCLPHQDFFRFATELLDRYEKRTDVGVISANNFAPNPEMRDSYYFSTHANIWGWATWNHTWREFRQSPSPLPLGDDDKRKLKSRLPGLFRSRGFIKLADHAAQLDSWAIQFAVMCQLNGWLCTVPKVNLAKNIGFGKESTHTKFESFADEIDTQPLGFPLNHPTGITPNYREMKRESLVKALRWVIFPISHPIDFFSRLFRAVDLFLIQPSRK